MKIVYLYIFPLLILPTAVMAGWETGPNAATTSSLSSALPSGLYLQGVAGAWSADSFDYTNDGAAINIWPDLSGNGNDLKCAALTYSHNACSGKAGVYFGTYGTSLATNANFTSNYSFNTNVTVFLVLKDLDFRVQPTLTDWVFSFGVGNGSFRWFDYSPGPPQGAGIGGPFSLNYGAMNAGEVDVMAISYNGSFYSAWQNGRQVFDGRYPDAQVSYPQTAGAGTSGDVAIGGLPNQGDFCGYVALALIYTNCLTPAQVQQNNSILCAAYGWTGNSITLSGDSLTIGYQGPILSNLTAFATAAFPGWLVENCGRSGMNSSNQVNYICDWAPSVSQSAQNVDLFMERINDDNGGLATSVTEANYIWAAAVAHSNFVKFIACTIPSYTPGDANGTRLSFNAWLHTHWNTFADGICDYAAVPQIGTNGACSNQPAYFYTDNTHLTGAGYMLCSNVEVGAIQSLLWPTANQFGTLYPSNSWNIGLFTNEIPDWGTFTTYSNGGGSWPVRVMIWNSNYTFMVQDPAL